MPSDLTHSPLLELAEPPSISVDGNGPLLRRVCLLAAILVSAFFAWSARYGITVDGISYLDIADAYRHHDWSTAINAYWSPLYSWVLALGLGIMKPASHWQFAAVQIINFLISLVTLWSFDWFWRTQREFDSSRHLETDGRHPLAFSRTAWLALGYSLFIWNLARGTIVSVCTPDLLICAIVLLASTILTRMRMGRTGFPAFAFLGLVLGVGYLAKSAMFVLAFVFLVVAFLAVGAPGKALRRGLVALAVFLAVSAPFIVVISRSKGRLTIGDAGKINYAWDVNKSAPFFNWQGGDPVSGIPKHPTRKLLSVPTVYEFASPIGGSYPPHYDPSYWNDGLRPHCNPMQEIRTLITSGYSFYSSIFAPQSGLVAGALVLLLLGGRAGLRRLGQNWHLWLPGCAAIGMYFLVTVEHRYVSPFVILLWAAVLSAIRLPDSRELEKLLSYVALAGVVTLSFSTFEPIGTRFYELGERSVNGNWEIADGLAELGIEPGDRVMSLGDAYDAYWARLAKVKIVAEVPTSAVIEFWGSGPSVQSQVMAICNSLGARAIVASDYPKGSPQPGWHKLGDTGFYAYPLPGARTEVSKQP